MEHLVRRDERRLRDVLVAVMGESRVAGAEVDRVDSASREVCDVGPRLLRPDGQITGPPERPHGGRVDHPARRRVADDLEGAVGRDDVGEERLGLAGLPIGRIAEIHRRRRLSGDDVVGDPGVEPRHRDDLDELETGDDGCSWLSFEERNEPSRGLLEGAVREPRPRRVATRAGEGEPGDDASETAGLDGEISGLEDDGERRIVNQGGAVEQRRQGVPVRRKLFATEEQQRDVAGRGREGVVAGELERDREAPLHVARAEPVHGVGRAPAGKVSLGRHRVVVRDEHDQRERGSSLRSEEKRLVAGELDGPAARAEPEHVLADRLLVAALGWNVDELERPRGEAFGERGHWSSVPGHNLAVTARQADPAPGAEPERALLLGVYAKGLDGAAELEELRELARTSGAVPVAEVVQHRSRPDPRTYVGKGKVVEVKRAYGDAAAEVLVVDDELTPTQQRTLEDELGARVVDRTQLILDIFAQHARSSEGKLQVELAQLEYNLPRMRGMWKHLERLGGGVGTRGPGESQLETDRRLARTRVSVLKRRLRTLGGQRATRRKRRIGSSSPTIALAGYTNVGKSTLLNELTGADATVDDRLFETLDPTTRAFEHDGKRYLVTDTVGFIRKLPTQLVEGFAATLEETLVADLVLHVADASLPEERLRETITAVESVLSEIGADDLPLELILNKVDRLDPLARRRVEHTFPRALLVSAATGEGLDELKGRIAELFSDRFEDVRLLVPYTDGAALTALYDLGAPIAERRDTDEGVHIRARLPRSDAARFARYLVADTASELGVSAS